MRLGVKLSNAILLCAICARVVFAQATSPAEAKLPPSSNQKRSIGPVDVLSDAHGVDIGSYLGRVVLPAVRRNWFNVIPRPAGESLLQEGNVSIQFSILRNGRVTEMKLVSPSGDSSLD